LKRLKNHPAIIHVYDVVSLPSEVYVMQELAQGGSLLDYIRDRKRVSEQLAIRFFLQVVAGLQYCHDREVRLASNVAWLSSPCRAPPTRAAAAIAGPLAACLDDNNGSPMYMLPCCACRLCTAT
jgi:hypothetical protein